MGKASFHGEKVGKSVVCLSANLRTGNQTIIPTDLETSKYSTKQQNFNLNGEYLEMFSALKAPENNRTYTTVILNHLHCSLLWYDICRIDVVYCSWITGAFQITGINNRTFFYFSIPFCKRFQISCEIG